MGKEMSRFVVSAKGPKPKILPRDVSPMFQKIREFLLGHSHIKHTRFEHLISPRSIPPPEIPHRGCNPKYHDHYYFNRHALNSIKPPVIADMERMKLTQNPAGNCEVST